MNEYPDVEMPPEPNPFFGYRMDLKFIRGIVHIESPTTAKVVNFLFSYDLIDCHSRKS